jgi:hypothetical protein
MFRRRRQIYQGGLMIYLGTQTAVVRAMSIGAEGMGAEGLARDAGAVATFWRHLELPDPTTWVLIAIGIACVALLRKQQLSKFNRRGAPTARPAARVGGFAQAAISTHPAMPLHIHKAA